MLKRLAPALAALLVASGIAWAVVQGTPTPIVAPESGEDSLHQGEVFNMARIKPGQCVATGAGTANAQTATCNGASGVVTSGLAFTLVSGAGASGTMVITNNKVQAGDICIALIDDNGATAASLLEVTGCTVTASTLTLKVVNNFTTANTVAPKFQFVVFTKGNPN